MAAAAGTEWVTGASDGSLAMWSQTKKRPTSVLRRAHGYPRPGLAPFNSQSAASVHGQVNGQVNGQDPTAEGTNGPEDDGPVGPGSVGGDAASWIGAVGVCKGTDLVVSDCALSCTLHHRQWSCAVVNPEYGLCRQVASRLVLTGLACLVADNVMVYNPDNFAESETVYRYIWQ